MNDTIMYILVIIISGVIVVLCNNDLDNQCEKAHGQVIVHSANVGHGCIYPAK